MTNTAITNNTTTNVVITKSLKSTGTSILLTLLFGSIGMFYSTIFGGLVMTFIVPPVMIYLLFAGKWIAFLVVALIYYPVCTIWGYNATKKYNTTLLSGADTTEKFDISLYSIIETGLILLFFTDCFYVLTRFVFGSK